MQPDGGGDRYKMVSTESQVADAALALVRTSTDSTTRSSASKFLERWNRSPQAWLVYFEWLGSFGSTTPDSEMLGMQLLCLQLLQSKIRLDVPRGTQLNDTLSSIQARLGLLLSACPQLPVAVISSASICTAALAVRCGGLQETIQICHVSTSIHLSTALRILAQIPLEVEACSDLANSDVTTVLWPFVEPVLDTIRRGLMLLDGVRSAAYALLQWAKHCRVSVSHLNSNLYGGRDRLLPKLVQLLSQAQYTDEQALVCASQALTEVILVPSDSCTPSRQEACLLMLQGIGRGFIVDPLRFASDAGWDDASHSLATLICTLVIEEVDSLVVEPAEALIELLLRIQCHPLLNVRMVVLECWLSIQEIPTSERHEQWKAPLFRRVLESILKSIAYPSPFCDWGNEFDIDQSEFEENRRLTKDVFISIYFLFRSEFVERMVEPLLVSQEWGVQEGALFGLTAPAREINARIKTRTGGFSISSDRDRTSEQLNGLVKKLLGSGSDPKITVETAASRHILVLVAVVHFIGAYATTWSTKCPTEAILQMLGYLGAAVQIAPTVGIDAGIASRSLLIGCSKELLSNASALNAVMDTVHSLFETGLSTGKEELMAAVAEGCTRLVVQMENGDETRHHLRGLATPLVRCGQEALNVLSADGDLASEEALCSVQTLRKSLKVLHVLIRFSDNGNEDADLVSDMMILVWPFLQFVATMASGIDSVFEIVLSIHEQLLKNTPKLVAPHFESTIKFAVDAFQLKKTLTTLAYMASAVEVFGASNELAFRRLLEHVSSLFFAHVSSESCLIECPDLVRGFFELVQRYLLYCPSALVRNAQFPSTVACAVECLTACKGERESTRSSLNFLSHLFGWRLLQVSKGCLAVLQDNGQLLDEQIAQHGERLAKICIMILLEGPQMLWPPCSDCIFALVSSSLSWKIPNDRGSNVARQWMNSATPQNYDPDVYQRIVQILLELVAVGTKNRPKAKMLLTDYCKICKGEMSVDCLVSYQLARI